MPRVDGFAAADRLQRDARTCDIPIVFVSAGGAEAAVRGLRQGAADFLPKPFHANELLARIDRALARSAERQHWLALANQDALTGLGNYRFLRERLDEEHARALRYHTPLALVLCSLPTLEGVVARQGPGAGNALLLRVAQQLRELTREGDVLARSGPAEFAVLLSHAAQDEAQRFLARVRAHMAEPPLRFGAACLRPDEPREPAALIRAAERARC
jgi:diguanylate cyclase (GGDEF)-like protein